MLNFVRFKGFQFGKKFEEDNQIQGHERKMTHEVNHIRRQKKKRIKNEEDQRSLMLEDFVFILFYFI